MENKENTQDDLVVSSTGEMLTKEESQERNSAVVEEQNVSVPDDSSTPEQIPQPSASEQSSPASAPQEQEPTGLAPPVLPTPPEQDVVVEEKPRTDDSNAGMPAEESSPVQVVAQPPSETNSMSDEDFAKKHSNHERGKASAHPTRNNKRVLALTIIVGALILSGIAIFVFISSQDNVSQSSSNKSNSSQEETIPVNESSVDETDPLDVQSDELDTELDGTTDDTPQPLPSEEAGVDNTSETVTQDESPLENPDEGNATTQ